MIKRTVIVGASHGGIAVAAKLRALDPANHITLISAESANPYQRPALSKAYLAGKASPDAIALRPASWFADSRIELLLGATVTSINRDEKSILLANGQAISYDTLVLATGASPRQYPAAQGGNLQGVYTVRDLNDADALKHEMLEGRNLVVIGGGYIGLEAASEASKKGIHVTVLEAADRIVKRVACIETSDHLRRLHESHGVTICEAASIRQIVGTGNAVTGVELENGNVLPADFVIVGIGILPVTALAEAAGLSVNNGIVVDQHLQTSDPHIYALGDCASFPKEGAQIRLESVQNANDQGAVAAANILGQHIVYSTAPWFWSDQFDMKLQIAGLNTGYDDVLVMMSNGTARAHLYFSEGRFVSADCFNDPVTFAMARKLLASGKVLTCQVAASANFSIKEFVNS